MPLGAQDRQLHWRAVNVEARLDGDGRLHVRETQSMVFTGDWNGGERIFDVGAGQQFRFERLLRVDSASGTERELQRGDLDEVDHYRFSQNTLRWRSRLPSDPPFEGTELTYVLEYSYSNVLVPQADGGFLLDHDFSFADRVGYIGQYSLNLTIDPLWGRPESFRGTFGPMSLPPGEGFVVSVPLQFQGDGRPGGVLYGAGPAVRYALAAALVVGLILMGSALVRREAALGRFGQPDTEPITDEWLTTHVFSMLPEVVGHAWDDSTAAPEVAAVLSRLVVEKKLASEIKTSGRGWFTREVLHLRLLVPRNVFTAHERVLIDALFTGSATETDTDKVRERYKSTGFDPASKIKKVLESRAERLDGSDVAPPRPSRVPTLILFVAAALFLIQGAITRRGDAPLLIFSLFAGAFIYVFSASQAFLWSRRVDGLGAHSLRFIIPILAAVIALILVLVQGLFRTGPQMLAGMTALCLAIANSAFNLAKTRQSAERIRQRKRLARARDWFQRELREPRPRLRDEWFPYLIAFGLGSHMDKWFRAFGGEAVQASAGMARSSSTSFGGSSSSSPSWSGMGGGGGFSGGGSSGSWASAVGVMAAGVSAPSSSSSGGGGGGGGGSSGGGGGGGW
jgi:uncharacterized membrane protein YgcG